MQYKNPFVRMKHCSKQFKTNLNFAWAHTHKNEQKKSKSNGAKGKSNNKNVRAMSMAMATTTQLSNSLDSASEKEGSSSISDNSKKITHAALESQRYVGSEAHHWWKWSKPIINLPHRYRIGARESVCSQFTFFAAVVFSSLMFCSTVHSWF